MLRLLIADDHEVVRKGLALVLGLEPGFEVVGEARDGVEAVQMAQALQPTIVLLDLKMPRLNGHAAAAQVRALCPAARIILLSGAEIDEHVLDSLNVVDGYVSKDISPAELARAIRTVAAGGEYFHAAITRTLMGQAGVALPAGPRPALSAREREVLQLMATAATYREIGAQLILSEETIRSHAKSILAKLDQPNRTQAVVAAVRLGLIQL
ncbi:MAG: response regulator transcription factor [Anaerolineales bacterium]|nr:response regulator transcription factor [Anaerolineales bacterium]